MIKELHITHSEQSTRQHNAPADSSYTWVCRQEKSMWFDTEFTFVTAKALHTNPVWCNTYSHMHKKDLRMKRSLKFGLLLSIESFYARLGTRSGRSNHSSDKLSRLQHPCPSNYEEFDILIIPSYKSELLQDCQC